MEEESGAAYREFLADVKRLKAPYMSDAWDREYRAALRKADLPVFAKLPLLALPLDPAHIHIFE